jgi:hypothetical protein
MIFTSFNVFAQIEATNTCKEILGKWETYYIQMPFGMEAKSKSETWIFNEDGTLIIDGKKTSYTLDEECSKLFVGSSSKFFSITILNDNLYMIKKIFIHESYVFRLKKIN